jgi:UrcA family protein
MNFVTNHPNLTRVARTAVLVGCSLAGALGVAQAATAGNEVPTIVVRYGDLNLATEDGVQTLYRRLSVAAQEVCPLGDPKMLSQYTQNKTCRAEAIARAVHDVNSPKLAALEAGLSKRG